MWPWALAAALVVLSVLVVTARTGAPEARQPAPTSTPPPTSRPAAAPALTSVPTAASASRATATPRPTAAAQPKPTSQATQRPTGPTQQPTSLPTLRPNAQQVVALTFDAGADRGYAEDILDFLHAEHITASFGITGNWARQNPDLVRRMAADGHQVINHSLDHQSFTGASDQRGGLTAAGRRAELDSADAIIAPLIGHTTRPWYRLPYGDDDGRVAADLLPAGYTRKVGWTVDTFGWRGASASDIVERSLRLASQNAIYVLHVGRSSQDGPALARIVTGLRERGFGFVSVEALPR